MHIGFLKNTLVGLLALATLSMYGCDEIYFDQAENQKQLRENKVRVAILNSALTYQERAASKYGLEHDLFSEFANDNNLKFEIISYKKQEDVLQAVASGHADLALARIPGYHKNSSLIKALSFEDSSLAIFCPRSLKLKNISAPGDSLNYENLSRFTKIYIRKFDNTIKLESLALKHSPETKVEVLQTEPENLFRTAFLNKKSCAVTEKLTGQYLLQKFPSFEYLADLGLSYSIEWRAHPSQVRLSRLLKAWFQTASRSDKIAQIHTRYESFHSALSQSDIRNFNKNRKTLLPQYQDYFYKASLENHLPWTFIAAVAYQESHWNHEARSFTGVLGLMQLTQQTAEHLGVEDRTDPEQSISGGARYLKNLIDITPKHLHKLDRWSLALISYNLGQAHLLDIQKLAESRGLNPYSWKHLRELLPLLEDPDFALSFEYGSARGLEAKAFVERCLAFYNLLNF